MYSGRYDLGVCLCYLLKSPFFDVFSGSERGRCVGGEAAVSGGGCTGAHVGSPPLRPGVATGALEASEAAAAYECGCNARLVLLGCPHHACAPLVTVIFSTIILA